MMDALPTELLIQVAESLATELDPSKLRVYDNTLREDIDPLEPIYALKSLCLTSRRLNIASTASLYSDIPVVDIGNVVKLFDTLAASPALAAFVKSIHIYCRRGRFDTWEGIQPPTLPGCTRLAAEGEDIAEEWEDEGGGGGGGGGNRIPPFPRLVSWAKQCPQLRIISTSGTMDPGPELDLDGLPSTLTTLELRHFSYKLMRNPKFWQSCASWVKDLRFPEVYGWMFEDHTVYGFFKNKPLSGTLRALTFNCPTEELECRSAQPIKDLAHTYPSLEHLDITYILQAIDFTFDSLRSLTLRIRGFRVEESCVDFAIGMLKLGSLPNLDNLRLLTYPDGLAFLDRAFECHEIQDVIAGTGVKVTLEVGVSKDEVDWEHGDDVEMTFEGEEYNIREIEDSDSEDWLDAETKGGDNVQELDPKEWPPLGYGPVRLRNAIRK